MGFFGVICYCRVILVLKNKLKLKFRLWFKILLKLNKGIDFVKLVNVFLVFK